MLIDTSCSRSNNERHVQKIRRTNRLSVSIYFFRQAGTNQTHPRFETIRYPPHRTRNPIVAPSPHRAPRSTTRRPAVIPALHRIRRRSPWAICPRHCTDGRRVEIACEAASTLIMRHIATIGSVSATDWLPAVEAAEPKLGTHDPANWWRTQHERTVAQSRRHLATGADITIRVITTVRRDRRFACIGRKERQSRRLRLRLSSRRRRSMKVSERLERYLGNTC